MTIKITLPLNTARRIELGLADPRREQTFALADEHLAQLTPEARALVGQTVARGESLERQSWLPAALVSTDYDDVLAYVDEAARKKAAEERQKLQERLDEVLAYVGGAKKGPSWQWADHVAEAREAGLEMPDDLEEQVRLELDRRKVDRYRQEVERYESGSRNNDPNPYHRPSVQEPELVAEVQALTERAQAERTRRDERKERNKAKAKAKAKEAEAEVSRLLGQVAPELLPRWIDQVLPERELQEHLERYALDGFPADLDSEGSRRFDGADDDEKVELTEDEYQRLQSLRALVEERDDVSVEVGRVKLWRPGVGDEYARVDRDGEVLVGSRTAALVTAICCGRKLTRIVALGELVPADDDE